IAGEVNRHGRATTLLGLAVGRGGDRRPRHLDALLEAAELVVDLNAATVPVAHIDEPVIGHRHAVHGVHAFGLPLEQEFSFAIHHGDALIAAPALAVGHVDVAVLRIDGDA